jgi:hypothetical protein
VRRTLRRFGDNQKEPEKNIRNNWLQASRLPCYSSAPETAKMFSKGKEEAAWFLTNRTYVDNATGGAHDKENAKCISQDMESIIENGGFRNGHVWRILWTKQGSCKKSLVSNGTLSKMKSASMSS